MSIEITDKLIGTWFVQCDDLTDWLAGLERIDEGVKLIYRFRYYEDDEAFGSKDKKNWYELRTAEPVEKVIETVRELANKLAEVNDVEIFEVLMDDSGIEGFMERFKVMPFAHVMTVTPEEAKLMGFETNEQKG